MRRNIAAAFLPIVIAVSALLVPFREGNSQAPADWLTPSQQDALVARVKSKLPAGWSVTRTVENQVPDGWRTFDNRSFGIIGGNDKNSFQLWFVPETWVGRRQPQPSLPEVAFVDEFKVKLISMGDSTIVRRDLGDLWRTSSVSLINGGAWMANRLFENRLTETDEEAQKLVNRFCADRACRDEAGLSLIVLGVPARTVNMDCAENGKGMAQEFCLHLVKDDNAETRRILQRVLAEPSSSTAARKSAARSLTRAGGDELSGPALMSAFRNERSDVSSILAAIAELDYRPAGQEILERLESEKVPIHAQAYASALAALRYAPAVPAIRQLSRTEDISSEWLLDEFQRYGGMYIGTELSLLRLIAPWGVTSNGVRLLLVSPARIPSSGRIRVAAAIENESVRGFNGILLGFLYGAVIVDNKIYERPMTDLVIGDFGLGINTVSVREIEFPAEVLDGKTHRIQFRVGSALSNELIITLPRP